MIPGFPDLNGLNHNISVLSNDLKAFFVELKRATNEIHEAATASMVLRQSVEASNDIMRELVIQMKKMTGED